MIVKQSVKDVKKSLKKVRISFLFQFVFYFRERERKKNITLLLEKKKKFSCFIEFFFCFNINKVYFFIFLDKFVLTQVIPVSDLKKSHSKSIFPSLLIWQFLEERKKSYVILIGIWLEKC